MAFINEYVSDEDIKKYKFDEKFMYRHPEYKSLPAFFKPYWAIDRERNTYVKWINGANPAIEDIVWKDFELYWEGSSFIFRLTHAKGCSKVFTDDPYLIVWNLIKMTPADLESNLKEKVLALFKEGLQVYGYQSISRQIPNTVVKFNF
ncbi:MAG TPA: hypothetical protein VK974_07425 [Methylophilaceae bacterium]|nr:hypothetical protein [Methylophilaceae bacterium]